MASDFFNQEDKKHFGHLYIYGVDNGMDFEPVNDPFLMLYYDTRNPLFVNQIHGIGAAPDCIFSEWKDTITKYHVMEDWTSEYYVILAMNDFLKGTGLAKAI